MAVREERRLGDVIPQPQQRGRQANRQNVRQRQDGPATQLFRQIQQGNQEKQQAIQERGQDLDVADRMMRVLDPNLPKPARQFLFRELSRNVGVNPKGERSREVGQMLMGMEPDDLDAMRRKLSQQVSNMGPGEVRQLTRGLLNGEMQGREAAQMLQQPSGSGSAGASGEASPGGEAQAQRGMPNFARQQDSQQQEQDPRFQEVSSHTLSGRQRDRRLDLEERKVRLRERQFRRKNELEEDPDPQAEVQVPLLSALGMEAQQGATVEDLRRQGFTIPSDGEKQIELAKTLHTGSTGSMNMLVEAASLVNLIDGRPETLGMTGSLTRSVDSAISQLNALGRQSIPGFAELQSTETVSNVKDRIINDMGIQDTAENAARVESGVLSLAYHMALSRGLNPQQAGAKHTIDRMVREIGESSSPAQFKATLQDVVQRSIRSYSREMAVELGKPGQAPSTGLLSDEEILLLARRRDMMPDNVIEALQTEVNNRMRE